VVLLVVYLVLGRVLPVLERVPPRPGQRHPRVRLLHGRDGVVHDRDAKFCGPFDTIFATEGVRVIETPWRAPRANAIAERWVRSVRSECLDHLLILGRRHLEDYNSERPHRSFALAAPAREPPPARGSPPADIRRRDLLGGVIHEYDGVAA
jgi:putative transposase